MRLNARIDQFSFRKLPNESLNARPHITTLIFSLFTSEGTETGIVFEERRSVYRGYGTAISPLSLMSKKLHISSVLNAHVTH